VIEVVGHGGAGDFYPGNSQMAIEKAIEIGVDRVEIDVQVAGDGSLVLVHDEHVLRFGKRVSIRQLSRAQIAESLDGLLTLEDAIELTRGKSALMVDLKSPGYERPVAAAIVRSNAADETIVSSTYAWSLRAVRRHAPGVQLGLSTGHISTVMRGNPLVTLSSFVLELLVPPPAIMVAKAIGAENLMVNYRICGETFVSLAHRFGLKVYPWTVNHQREINRMVDLGVDGIISNRPDLVIEARRRADEPA
jgi:glycerophosphoryl diester phosphodiesterase